MSVDSPSHDPPPTASATASPIGAPLRRCVSCRGAALKIELIRVARQPNGEIVIGADAAGRGAYLHRDPDCVAAAVSNPKLLSRVLRRQVSEAVLSTISQHADLP